MRRMCGLLLALIVAGPGPLFAQTVRVSLPGASASGSAAAASVNAPAAALPGLAAPPLTIPALGAAPLAAPSAAALAAQAPAALAPALAAPSKALPASVIPEAKPYVPAALAPKHAAPSAVNDNDAEPEIPKSALDQAKSGDSLSAAKQDEAGENSAAKSSGYFDGARSVLSAVSDALIGATEGSFHPLARVKSAPPESTGDDGGGPSVSRKVRFNGEDFPSVAFRPNDPVEERIVRAIELSKTSIKIALYEFTSRGILKALLQAHARGVKIEIVLCDTSVNPRNEPDADYERFRSEQIWTLIRRGIDVTVVGRPTKYGINHHKFAVFDGAMVEFGSYNWTYTSEKNHYENVLFSADADRVKAYEAAWDHLRALSVSVQESETRNDWPLNVPPPPSDAQKRVSFNGARLPAWIFNPGDLYEDSLVAAIDASKSTIDAAAFVLESRKVADALGRALARGVKVRVVSDKSQAQYDHVQAFLGWLQRRGAQVHLLGGPNGEESSFPLAEKMHNKYFVFDGALVETGSANATTNAGVNNFENANFIDDATDVAAFAKAFGHMFDAAETAPAYPEVELPTHEQMVAAALAPRGPPGQVDPPTFPALPAAGRFAYGGQSFPKSAIRPNEPAEPEIVKLIDSAKKTLQIGMYELNMQGVWDALQRAKKRKVKITIVLDRGHVYTTGVDPETNVPRKPKQMVVDLLKDGWFDVKLLRGRLGGIMHNKFIVADGAIATFGSYNYTQQSEDDHWENVFFTTEKKRVAGYMRYFDYLRAHPMAEDPDLEKLDEIMALPGAWSETMDKEWDKAHGRTRAHAAFDEEEDGSLQPEAAGGRAKKPLPPNPPQETETPVKLNGEEFPLHMFSPNAGIEQALVRAIDASKKTIQIAMFSFFSQPIAEALLRAKERGVAVQVVMDRSQTGNSKVDDWFAWHGVEVRLIRGPDNRRDPRYQKMHNKFGIFDGLMLASGSFNYSSRAEALSFENINYFNDADEIARFAASFLQMWERGKAPIPPRREPKFAVPAGGDDA